MSHRLLKSLACAALLLATHAALAADPVAKKLYGTTADGDSVNQFTLTNAKGSTLKAIEYGATITNLVIADKAGKPGDLVLGYDTLKEYELSVPSMGNLVGRFANRIAGGTFKLSGQGTVPDTTYHLTQNQGANTLHGGFKGDRQTPVEGRGRASRRMAPRCASRSSIPMARRASQATSTSRSFIH